MGGRAQDDIGEVAARGAAADGERREGHHRQDAPTTTSCKLDLLRVTGARTAVPRP
ncbi:hypothetical protein AB0M05_09750 [Streptomyces violaceusniger]|uniref:hypothetical protein n=1 Tax=Streptomyces violaceusniger TaxID=68280 RepID=UPI003438DF2E